MNAKTWTRLINDGGDGYMPEECIEQSQREYYAAKAARLNRTGWSVEATIARRAAWNDIVKSGALNGPDGKADMRKVKQQERKQGWTMQDLRGAVSFWDLSK